MRQLSTILVLIIATACNQDGIGCFKSGGKVITQSVSVPYFNKVEINDNVSLEITKDAMQSVDITTGSNLLEGIQAQVIDSVLVLHNNNTCNWMREYRNPVVTISNPDLLEITQHGYGSITSYDTLDYSTLRIISIEGSGDINLIVDLENLGISSNNIANYYVSGTARNLNLGFYFNDAIFFGKQLMVEECKITHRGSNTMHLNVSNSIKGVIDSFGDVVLYEQMPLIVEVDETSRGRILIKGN